MPPSKPVVVEREAVHAGFAGKLRLPFSDLIVERIVVAEAAELPRQRLADIGVLKRT